MQSYDSRFTFNGVGCGQFGIVVQTVRRPVMPRKRRQFYEIPGRHGTAGWDQYASWDDVTVSLDCAMAADSQKEFRDNARKAARWLRKSGRLSFSDEPERYYQAELLEETVSEELFATGIFTLSFHCAPFAAGPPRLLRHSFRRTDAVLRLRSGGSVDAPCKIALTNASGFAANTITITVVKRK